MPHDSPSGRRSPNERPVGPPRPSSDSGKDGHGIRVVEPRSRRANASTPTAKSTIATSATGMSDTGSGEPPNGWWWTVQPNQVRFADPANAGTAA